MPDQPLTTVNGKRKTTMYISEILAEKFGPFGSIKVVFRPTGLSIVSGENATGKSQLSGAILAAIVGRSALRLDTSGLSPSSISLTLVNGDYKEHISLGVEMSSSKSPKVTRNTQTTPRNAVKQELALTLLATIADPNSPSLLLDFGIPREPPSASDFMLTERLVPKSLRSSVHWAELRRIASRPREVGSVGQQQIAQLIREFVVRQKATVNIPLLIDDNLWSLDDQSRHFSFEIIREISKTTQVILFTTESTFPSEEVVASLKVSLARDRHLASYNYAFGDHKVRINARLKTKYTLGQRYPSQENRYFEFKEIKGTHPLSSIKSVVDQYAVAYLNSTEPLEGRIVWGVTDGDIKVVGVSLTDQECDELRRTIVDKLHQITPAIAPTAYRVEFHEIGDGRRPIPNLYLIEVKVPSARRTLLFATGSQEVYVKTDAGKKKLTIAEIQQELLSRCGIDEY